MFWGAGEFGEEGERGGFGYSHVGELSCEGFVAVEYDYPVAGSAGDELGVGAAGGFVEVGFFAGAFDKYGELLIEKVPAYFIADIFLNGEEFYVSFLFHFGGDSVGEAAVGGCSGAGGVFEDEAVFITGPLDEFDGLPEVVVGFSGEAYDEVAGYGDVGYDCAGGVEEGEVFGGGVAAVHRFEDVVGAALGRDVEVVADLREGGHCAADGVEIFFARVVGDKAEPFDAGDIAGHFEDVGEAVCFFAGLVFVGVDGLAEERDEFDALVGEPSRLFDDGGRGA